MVCHHGAVHGLDIAHRCSPLKAVFGFRFLVKTGRAAD
jgi:hypothetical protein